MTKVEELRLDIIQDLARLKFMEGKHKEMTWGELEHHYGYPLVDPLISAARSEGVAAGAEQMKEAIRRVAEFTTAENPILSGPLVTASYSGHPAQAREQNIAIIPASVLAPTKESEK